MIIPRGGRISPPQAVPLPLTKEVLINYREAGTYFPCEREEGHRSGDEIPPRGARTFAPVGRRHRFSGQSEAAVARVE